jgi:hypothetical protein
MLELILFICLFFFLVSSEESFIEVPVLTQESGRSFYDFGIGFWNCSNSVVFSPIFTLYKAIPHWKLKKKRDR